jgi:acyl-CoA reductase-like NAD-dependent aldehyde dehydrogenase
VIAGPKVYDNLVSEVVSKVSEMKVGDIFDDEAAMGSVVSDVQLDRIRGFVDRAREGGATINIGGEVIDQPGSWYAPTVVTDVAQDSEIVQNEVFGRS